MAASVKDPAVVRTDKGSVRGTLADDYREFLGIPYAAGPVGKLRWASPQQAAPWVQPRDATKPGRVCAPNPFQPQQAYGEDCLNLNVTTPRSVRRKPLPVMVFIHGGAFQFGTGSGYRPRDLAAQGDVVVVTINYRLGAFGFLAHRALDGRAARQRSGNFGIEDQQAALRWVRRNAAAFGGDARNVTIFGQSSGARSVCAQLASPEARRLFHRAIMQSEPCTMTDFPDPSGAPSASPPGFPRSRQSAEAHGTSVAGGLGCNDQATAAACLRALDAEKLWALGDFAFAPVYGGGGVLPVDPAEALGKGRFNKVPVIHGMNRDEQRVSDAFAEVGYPPQDPLNEDQYVARVKAFVGEDDAAEVLARYPVRAGYSPSEAWSAVVTDAVWARPMAAMNRDLASRVPTYAYRFSDRQAPWLGGLDKPSFPTGAYHSAELAYLFEADEFAGRTLSPSQQRLSAQMIRYWTRFAYTGNPNGPGTPHWARADRNTSLAQSLDDGRGGIRPVNFDRSHHYRFWRSLKL